MNDRDIAIVGMGCAFPQARDRREYWRNVVNGVDCIQPLPPHRLKHCVNWWLPDDHPAHMLPHRAGFLPDDLAIDPLAFGLLPNAVKHGEADQFLLLKVVEEALQDAGLAKVNPHHQRTDVLIGRGGYPGPKHVELSFRSESFDTVLELLDRQYPELLNGRRAEIEDWLQATLPPAEVDSLATAIPNIAASRVANRFDLGGTAEVIDAACASSLLALEHAIDRLRSGRADAAVVGGLFLSQNMPFLMVFNRLHEVSPSGVIRPMDRRADGLLMGEGAGAVVVKRLEDAVAAGDRIYAIVKGTGSSSDGRGLDVLAPAYQGQVRAVQRAYADAGVDPADVGYLELHGTGTHAGDLAEITTVREIYGVHAHPPTSRAMGSVKSQIGHLMPASGLASLIRVALSLSNKILPPSLHCDEPREETLDCAFYVNTQTRPWVQNQQRGHRFAAINSFGFGGVNVHAVLEEAVPVRKRGKSKQPSLIARDIEPAIDRPSELALFAAESIPALLKQLETARSFVNEDLQPWTAADLSRSLAEVVDFRHPVKLAIVFTDADVLTKALGRVIEQLTAGATTIKDAEEIIYFSTNGEKPPGKIAFIFPGMGFPGLIGNYPDHLMELCLHYPELRAEFDFFEERDRHPDDLVPTSSVFVPPPSLPEAYRTKLKERLAPPKTDTTYAGEQKPEERYLAAMGVTLANWISWTLLEQFKMPVELATGQSQGEMAAVCAVGLGDFHESAPAYWKVLNVSPTAAMAGRLAFVWAEEEKVAPLVAENPGTHIAIYMAPNALILGGNKEGLVRITDALKKEQCLTQILPYPAIHTPALTPLLGELEDALKDEKFAVHKPRMTLYSSITTEPYPTDMAGVRKTLMLNLDHPLRVWQTIQRMSQDGARVFVQVGGGHMSAHMKHFMPVGEETITAALDVDTRDPLTQLNHLLGTLFVGGVKFLTDPLFAHRESQVLDLTAPRGPLPRPKMLLPLRLEWSPLDSAAVPERDRQPAADEPLTQASNTAKAVTSDSHARQSMVSAAEEIAIPAAPATLTPEPVAVTVPEPSVNISHVADDFEQAPAVVEFDVPFPILLQANVTHYVPEQELRIERILDADTDPYLLDHLFIRCPSRDPRDCLPIVPMTMSLEFIAETAALLCPGLGVIGYEQVKAMRWVGLEDRWRTLLTFEARLVEVDEATGERRVDVLVSYEGKRAFSGRVVFGTEYRQTLDLEWPDLSQEPGWPEYAHGVYDRRRMFHGPMFHVISSLGHFTNPVATGTLRVLPKDRLFAGLPEPALLVDPCLLDGIGQFVGLWCQTYGWSILPTGVEKIELYGPTPPVGTDCVIKLAVTQFDVELKQLKANFEVEDGQGRVWMRMVGWGDWIFRWTPEFLDFNRDPGKYSMSEILPLQGLPDDALAVQLYERHIIGVDLMWVARTALTARELAEFRQLDDNNRIRRAYLLSRLAAKDAARLWCQKQWNTELTHPAVYELLHDELGKPVVQSSAYDVMPELTITHKDGIAIVIASSTPLGVDIEKRDRVKPELLETFATAAEGQLLQSLEGCEPGAGWETRLWCAKEAAGKAKGAGLNGYPKRLEVQDVGDGSLWTVCDTETAALYEVQLHQLGDFVLATASPLTVAGLT